MFSATCRSLVLAGLLVLTGCDSDPSTEEPAATVADEPAQRAPRPGPAEECELTMGWDPWQPYQYRDVGGEVHGLDVEIVAAIAEKSGCELSFVSSDWATLLELLRTGDVDILTGATKNEQREEFAYFTEPYRDESFGLYVRAGEAEEYPSKNLEGLLEQGFRLGVTQEYVYGGGVSELEDSAQYADQFVPATVGEVNYTRLLNQEIDGFLEDPYVAASVMRTKGLTEEIESHPFVIEADPVSLMISKSSVSPETARKINQSLVELKAQNDYRNILAKYLEVG
ncbi:MAG: substrate-binding periplasmic protein, partial [Gammaproteobacteria bacterium]